MVRAFLVLILLAAVSLARAGEARVVSVVPVKTGATWRFDVTVRHADAGWDHYADAFVVSTPDGEELGRRVLHHPHVDEQPFTRSLGGVALPEGVRTVTVHAVDSVHGPGPAVSVPLP